MPRCLLLRPSPSPCPPAWYAPLTRARCAQGKLSAQESQIAALQQQNAELSSRLEHISKKQK